MSMAYTKEQNAKKAREWRKNNPDSVKASSKRYREKNKELVKKRIKDWYIKNKEYYKTYHKEWNQRNPDYQKKRHLRRKYNITILCINCNLVIGNSRENKDFLLKTINYLTYHNVNK